MSIASEITRLQTAKANIKTSIEGKGVVVSSSAKLDEYSDYVDLIETPNLQTKTITPQNQTREIVADNGYNGLSKVVLDGLLVDAHDSYTSTTDDDVAYEKIVPSGALKYASLDKLGGMSYKCFNLAPLNNEEYTRTIITSYGVVVIPFTNSINIENGKTYSYSIKIKCDGAKTFNKIAIAINPNDNIANSVKTVYASIGTTYTTITYTFTATSDNVGYGIWLQTVSSNATYILKEYMLNEGSTVLPYQPYFEGIRDSAVTSVVSKDSNNDTLDTLTIPAEVQALTGYGWGTSNSVNNYIDFGGDFVKKIVKITFNGSENWEDRPSFNDCDRFVYNIPQSERIYKSGGEGLCDKFDFTTSIISTIGTLYCNQGGQIGVNFSTKGTTTLAQFKSWLTSNNITLYLELAEPVITDISQYIDNNFIEVEENGTITFNNTYNQAVPSEVTCLVEV